MLDNPPTVVLLKIILWGRSYSPRNFSPLMPGAVVTDVLFLVELQDRNMHTKQKMVHSLEMDRYMMMI